MVTFNNSVVLDDFVQELLNREPASGPDLAVQPAGHSHSSIVLFSDDELFRAGCALHLRRSGHLHLAHSAGLSNWRTALGAMRLDATDVVVVESPSLASSALDAIETVRSAWPQVAVMLVAGHIGPESMGMVRELASRPGGGVATLTRASVQTASDLIQAIEGVRGGRVVLDPLMLGQLVDGTPASASTFGTRLSPREREVLVLMAQGMTNAEVATCLCLEVKTVERHINGIYNKLPEYSGQGHPRVNTVVGYLKVLYGKETPSIPAGA